MQGYPTLATSTLRVKSPVSDTIIIEYDPDTGWTRRFRCERCLDIVDGTESFRQDRRGIFFENGIGDPIYFLGAGIEYDSEIIPRYGRVAWARTPEGLHRMRNFVEPFRKYKVDWRRMTGVPFPNRLFR